MLEEIGAPYRVLPYDNFDGDQLTAAFASNPELLATAQNYWLYTNRHLKLTRELQAQARRLAETLDSR